MNHKRRKKGGACSKLSFSTKEAAERTLEIAAKQRGEAPKKLRIYRCPACGKFHFSSLSREEVEDARKR